MKKNEEKSMKNEENQCKIKKKDENSMKNEEKSL